MNEASRFARLPFLIIVALCFVQVAWWVLFQFREAESREQLEQLRLETLCSLASTSIAPATANTPNHSIGQCDHVWTRLHWAADERL